jgi:hypothetical protein
MNPVYLTLDDVKHKLSLPWEGVVFAVDAPNTIYRKISQRPYWKWIKSDKDIADYRKVFNESVIVGKVH